jgi:hypothetical protein
MYMFFKIKKWIEDTDRNWISIIGKINWISIIGKINVFRIRIQHGTMPSSGFSSANHYSQITSKITVNTSWFLFKIFF